MNIMRRVFSLFVALCLAVSLVACGNQEENTTTEDQDFFETKQLSETEQAAADEAALADFIQQYRDGKYDEEKLFRYEDLSVYYQLGEYIGVEYPDDAELEETVTDQEVTDYLTGIQVVGTISDDEYTELTEGVVQKFDVVTIDYKGYIDGVEQENATAEGEELLIGSNSYIDGFETGLIGKEIGKETVLNLKFSPYYSDASVAGKEIDFHVTVKKAERPTIPELTVETINKLYGSSFETMEQVREDIKGYLEETKQNKAYSYAVNYVQLEILDRSTVISYPQKELDYYRSHFINYYTQEMGEDVTLEEYCQDTLGMTQEEFEKEALSYAEETVAGTMMVRLIAQKEGITCSDEQMEAIIVGLYANVSSYYGTMESFLVDYIDLYGADYFEQQVVSAAVSAFLLENAVKVG